MRSLNIWAGAVFSGAVLLMAATASAKGPAGGGLTTRTPGVPQGQGASQGQGVQGGTWTSPPGWSQGDRKGWDGATTPPGFDNGNRAGWSTGTLPPGIQKKQ
jgi:hypothetical protein